MFWIPHSRDDTRSERACGVQTAASVVDSNHFGDEKGQPNADWSHECCLVLFVRQHVNGENELSCQDCFDLSKVSANFFDHTAHASQLTKTPRATDVPGDNVVRTLNGVGNSTETMNDAKIAPTSWEATRSMPLVMVIAFTMTMAIVTAGLKL